MFVMATKVVHKGHTCKGCKSAPLDTSAQLGTNDNLDDFSTHGGISISDKKALQKKARKKYMTKGYSRNLVDASKANPDSTLRQSYWNTYHCAKEMTIIRDSSGNLKCKVAPVEDQNGNLRPGYCKNRWCLVCNSIRTAKLIKTYSPELESWKDRQFVTLTVPNVEAFDLKESIDLMQSMFQRIKNRINKRARRGSGNKLKGVRKLEIIYKPLRNDFNQHYHLIVEGGENARLLRTYWLKEYNNSPFVKSGRWGPANKAAQDITVADDNSVKELFKYFTKVISESWKGDRMIYVDAMDILFNAVKGRRVFQNFGFKVDNAELTDEEEALAAKAGRDQAIGSAEWNNKHDWEVTSGVNFDEETGEVIELPKVLSGYVPGDKIKELVTDKVVYRRNHSWKRWARSAPTYPNKKRECANTPAAV